MLPATHTSNYSKIKAWDVYIVGWDMPPALHYVCSLDYILASASFPLGLWIWHRYCVSTSFLFLHCMCCYQRIRNPIWLVTGQRLVLQESPAGARTGPVPLSHDRRSSNLPGHPHLLHVHQHPHSRNVRDEWNDRYVWILVRAVLTIQPYHDKGVPRTFGGL